MKQLFLKEARYNVYMHCLLSNSHALSAMKPPLPSNNLGYAAVKCILSFFLKILLAKFLWLFDNISFFNLSRSFENKRRAVL